MVEEIVDENIEQYRRIAQNGHVLPGQVDFNFFMLADAAVAGIKKHYNGHIPVPSSIEGHLKFSQRFLESVHGNKPVPLYSLIAAGGVVEYWSKLEQEKTRRSDVSIDFNPEAE